MIILDGIIFHGVNLHATFNCKYGVLNIISLVIKWYREMMRNTSTSKLKCLFATR